MPWEKKKKYPIQDCTWGIKQPVNQAVFTRESLQRLIKGLEKSQHYRTIVFDTMPSWMEEKNEKIYYLFYLSNFNYT